MKAFITSFNEITTGLCVWRLEEQGFETVLLQDETTLADKLKRIYDQADDDFVRVDADIVPNQNLTPQNVLMSKIEKVWWTQFMTFDWFKQDLAYGGVQFIRKAAIPYLRKHINEAMNEERPETYMSRIEAFYNPRRFQSDSMVIGLQNYKNDMNRVRQTKERRGQSGYDWDLVGKLNDL